MAHAVLRPLLGPTSLAEQSEYGSATNFAVRLRLLSDRLRDQFHNRGRVLIKSRRVRRKP